MLRIPAALLFMGVLVGAGTDDSNLTRTSPSSGFRDLFCPECLVFCADEWSHDAEGNCRQCSRRPVEVEAAVLRWYRCVESRRWGRKPCESDTVRKCCALYTATAIVMSDGLGRAVWAYYCPACRLFADPSDSGKAPACRGCGLRAARTQAMDRTWYWCRGELKWFDLPCSMDRTGKCDIARTIRVPAVGVEF